MTIAQLKIYWQIYHYIDKVLGTHSIQEACSREDIVEVRRLALMALEEYHSLLSLCNEYFAAEENL